MELSAIERGGGTDLRHVLEIGAGYGRMAYVVLSLFENCRYAIVDIQPALTISRWYLSQLFEPDRLEFLTLTISARCLEGRWISHCRSRHCRR